MIVEFRAGELEPAIIERQSPGQSVGRVADRDLGRYYQLVQDELARITLSEAEASLVVDALNGTIMEPHTYRLLWAEVDDAVRLDGLDRKWGVDGDALVTKLRALSPGATMAVVDAAERYWAAAARGESPTVRSVGLVR